MSLKPRILLIGTADTKSPELTFLRDCIVEAGGEVVYMDVGVLARGTLQADIPNEAVAAAAGSSLAEIAACGDENPAMARMAEGAARLAARAQAEGRIDGMLALGGTMGTDLALDVASALPLGVPKMIVSTIAFSHLIPPERVSPDLMMILWAGGLYGLNAICRSSLAQAAGAVVGACRAARKPFAERPLIGMTSLGRSCLRYMEFLLPELDKRGYDVAVFHTTGMGGRAFEALAASGRFAAVMDFSLQELANHCAGSIVTAGADRLQGAGLRGVPQLVAPGAIDMIDFPAWRENPWQRRAPQLPRPQPPARLRDRDRGSTPPGRAQHRRETVGREGTDRLSGPATGDRSLGPRGRAHACAGSARGVSRRDAPPACSRRAHRRGRRPHQ